MPSLIRFLAAFAVVLPLRLAAADPASIDVAQVFAAAARKALVHDAAYPQHDAFPDDARGPRWKNSNVRVWTSGFYPGMLWYIHEYARRAGWPDAQAWRERAQAWTMPLAAMQDATTTHDLGFMVFDCAGHGYRLTGDPLYKDMVLRSAAALAERFLPSARIIRSWGKVDDQTCVVVIDNMMNLELLWWASDHGGTTRGGSAADLKRIVTTHADRVMELFFRPDVSTCHKVELDGASGALLRRTTFQGKGPDSCWSRGQTWAIYGFAYLAEVTGEERYLQRSLAAADYYLARLPADLVPPADFDSTLSGLAFRDSSAAPVAASAFYRLSRLLAQRDPARAARLRATADATLATLTRPPYFSADADQAGLLLHGARNYHPDPANRLTDVSLIWGDYYLLEALLQYDANQRGGATP